MKLYTFLDKNWNIICQTKAENHTEAIRLSDTKYSLTTDTDFYSETY